MAVASEFLPKHLGLFVGAPSADTVVRSIQAAEGRKLDSAERKDVKRAFADVAKRPTGLDGQLAPSDVQLEAAAVDPGHLVQSLYSAVFNQRRPL